MQIQIKRNFLFLIACLLCVSALAQQPAKQDSVAAPELYKKYGIASFYSNRFNGRRTTNGEIFSQKKLTAAHRTLPLGTRVKVTNPKNGRWIIVRINDRGPRPKKRLIDLSYRAAKYLGIVHKGTMRVLVEELPKKAKPSSGMQFGEKSP